MRTFPNHQLVIIAGLIGLLTGCATMSEQKPPVPPMTAQELERIAPKTAPNLPLEEIVKLSKSKTPPEQIIEKIKLSNSSYELAPSQTLALSKQGVSAQVLDYIHTDREQQVRKAIADEMNRRQQQADEQHRQEQERLMRDYQFRYNQFYDPYWGPGISPFWNGYWPYYRPYYYAPRHRPHKK